MIAIESFVGTFRLVPEFLEIEIRAEG